MLIIIITWLVTSDVCRTMMVQPVKYSETYDETRKRKVKACE